jgi:hypothetical protein
VPLSEWLDGSGTVTSVAGLMTGLLLLRPALADRLCYLSVSPPKHALRSLGVRTNVPGPSQANGTPLRRCPMHGSLATSQAFRCLDFTLASFFFFFYWCAKVAGGGGWFLSCGAYYSQSNDVQGSCRAFMPFPPVVLFPRGRGARGLEAVL